MSGDGNVAELLSKLSSECKSSPVFHAALGLQLSQCGSASDGIALSEFVRSIVGPVEIGGDASNFAKVTVNVNPLGVQFSGSRSNASQIESGNLDNGNGEVPLPSDWLVRIDDMAQSLPKVKGSLFLCADRWCVSADNKCYHIPLSNIRSVCQVPAPNGQETYVGVALNSPLLVGKTKHTVLLFKFETLAELQVTIRDVKSVTALVKLLEPQSSKLESGSMVELPGPVKLDSQLALIMNAVYSKQITVQVPRPLTFISSNSQFYVQAYYKANDGPLYFLEDGMFFTGKPLLYLSDIDEFKWESCGGRSSNLSISMKLEEGAKKNVIHQFGLIPQEEVVGIGKYLTKLQNKGESSVKNVAIKETDMPAAIVSNSGVRKSNRAEVVQSSMGIVRLTDANDRSDDDDDDAYDESDFSSGTSGTDDDEDDEDDENMKHSDDDNADDHNDDDSASEEEGPLKKKIKI